MPPIERERTGPEVLTIRFDDIQAGWEQWVMLSSDHHWDNQHTDLTLLKRHLERAKERNALVFVFGDLFCAMQGKYDKRSSRADVRPEHDGDNYLDLLVETASEFYAPYADNIALISEGNHETSIIDRNGTSLLSNLAHRLNLEAGGSVEVGPYSGWVRFMFKAHKTRRQSFKLYYHHGAGGGGPVTRGVIQTNRQAVYLSNADIVVNGHTHDGWIVPIAREGLSDMGKPRRDLLWFVRTPSYKNEFGKNGWADRTWKPPKPLGCVWARFYQLNDKIELEFVQDIS